MPDPSRRPPAPIRALLKLWLLVMLAWLGFMSLSWNLAALVLRRLLPPRRAREIGRAGISRVYRIFWATARWSGLMRIDSSALDALREVPGGMIIAANHPSLLDAMLIAARLPRSGCVMKGSLMRNPFLGAGAGMAGYVVNDDPRVMIRTAVESLGEGCQLIFFPEGTRSPGPRQLHPFTRSLAVVADRARVPVQTVVIETDSPYLGKGWPLWKLPPIPIVFSARLGPRFDPDRDHAALIIRMQDYFARELRS